MLALSVPSKDGDCCFIDRVTARKQRTQSSYSSQQDEHIHFSHRKDSEALSYGCVCKFFHSWELNYHCLDMSKQQTTATLSFNSDCILWVLGTKIKIS